MEDRHERPPDHEQDVRRLTTAAMGAVLVLGLAAFTVLGGPRAAITLAQAPLPTPTPSPTATAIATVAATATATLAPTATWTPSPTATATPAPTATSTPVPPTTNRLRVPAGSTSTVQVTLARGALLEGSFTVDRDVNFAVLAPGGTAAYNPGRVSGKHSFAVVAAVAGAYTISFDNRFSLLTAKQIDLQYRVLTEPPG